MEPYWVRLSRFGNKFAAFVSIDGQCWVQILQTRPQPQADQTAQFGQRDESEGPDETRRPDEFGQPEQFQQRGQQGRFGRRNRRGRRRSNVPVFLEQPMNADLLIGIPVCSTVLQTVGDKEIAIDTVIKMDNVSATGWTPPPLPVSAN